MSDTRHHARQQTRWDLVSVCLFIQNSMGHTYWFKLIYEYWPFISTNPHQRAGWVCFVCSSWRLSWLRASHLSANEVHAVSLYFEHRVTLCCFFLLSLLFHFLLSPYTPSLMHHHLFFQKSHMCACCQGSKHGNLGPPTHPPARAHARTNTLNQYSDNQLIHVMYQQLIQILQIFSTSLNHFAAAS